jgi:hypothetical protein
VNPSKSRFGSWPQGSTYGGITYRSMQRLEHGGQAIFILCGSVLGDIRACLIPRFAVSLRAALRHHATP